MRVGFRNGKGNGRLVVAGEFLRLDPRLDGGLDHGLDLEKAIHVLTDLARREGGVGLREILFVDAAFHETGMLPCLVRREGEDRREQARQTTKYLVHRGL